MCVPCYSLPQNRKASDMGPITEYIKVAVKEIQNNRNRDGKFFLTLL